MKPPKTTDLHIAVVCGGSSSEREISLLSGKAVFEALREGGHRVILVDYGEGSLKELKTRGIDFVFIAMHGRFGEDGELQRILEREGFLYSGSSPDACRHAMDKVEARRRFVAAGLEVAPAEVVRSVPEGLRSRMGCPLFLKPARGGSSIGITRVEDRGGLEVALRRALEEDEAAILESALAGREFTVGILGTQALPPLEIITSRPFFDYEAKYQDPSTQYVTDPDLTRGERQALERVALKAHDALGLEVFSRVDLIQTPGGAAVIEVNAIPGLTSKSLLPKMARKAGIGFEELLRIIIEKSLVRLKMTGSSSATC